MLRWSDPAYALQIFSLMRFAAYFFVSILLVKIGVSTDRIGTYEYVLFLSSIVTGWWIHGLIQSYMAEAGEVREEEAAGLFRRYSQLLTMMSVVISLVLFLVINRLEKMDFLTLPPDGFYYFLGFHLLLQASILMVYYFYQKKWSRGIYLIGTYIFILYVFSFLFLITSGKSLAVVYRWLLVGAMPLLVLWVYHYRGDKKDKRGNQVIPWRIIGVSQLMIIQGIGFLSAWSDGFWVQYFYGADETFALFRYGGRELPLFVVLTSTFSTAMITWKSEDGGLERIREGSRRFIHGFLWTAILLLCTSQWLFAWLYSDEFVMASVIFDLYLLLILFRVLFARPLLIAEKKYRGLMGIAIAELLTNVVMSYILYWSLGLIGLVVATLLAHFVEFGLYVLLVKKRLRIRLEEYIPVQLYLWFVGVVLVVFFVKYGWFSTEWLLLLR